MIADSTRDTIVLLETLARRGGQMIQACYASYPMRIEQFAMWLATGERGLSSDAIVTQLTGVPTSRYFNGWDHPHDAADWRRCEMLLRQVPEARQHLDRMRARPEWAAFVDAWDGLVELARTAPGFFEPWKYSPAPALSSRIRELLAGVTA